MTMVPINTLDMQIRSISKSRLPEVDFDNLGFGRIFSDHMFLADYQDGKWGDFRIEPFGKLDLTPATCSLHYAQSIFEGMKAFEAENGDILVFRPDQNFARLNTSAERMCMPTVPEEVFMGGLTQLLRMDKNWIPKVEGGSLYIRPFMFATEEFLGVRPATSYKFIIFTSPVGAYYNEPVRVKIETHYVRAATGGTGYAKAAGNYAASIYPARQGMKEGFHQLLWTDSCEHQYIEESGTMNVMFLINNTLITAPTGETILDGVTRKSVLQIAKEWGYQVEERPVRVKEVIEAAQNGTLQEAFGVGTAATISHIVLIGYNGEKYELSSVENRPFASRIFNELDGLKRGKINDTRDWIYRINTK